MLFMAFVAYAFQCFETISWKCAWKNVNVTECWLKCFIQHMCEMVLELLGTLNCEKPVTFCCQTTQLLLIITIISVTQLIRRILQLQTHISTHSSNFWIFFHVCPHFINRILLWLYTNISQNAIFRIEQFTEALKE